jgi:gamma-glutamylcyclotransferase (GGCT)/AIG2-like uncharacterized protein YtfP
MPDAPPINPRLFVYGTLMAAAGHRMGARLARESRLLGPATIQGRLYDLGRYPGLVPSEDAGDAVHGEVVVLADPAASLRWLDAYEGIAPGREEQSEYERVERPVRLATGAAVIAWAYVYRSAVSAGRRVPGGRWLDSPGAKGRRSPGSG